jgi:hypothetical protein
MAMRTTRSPHPIRVGRLSEDRNAFLLFCVPVGVADHHRTARQSLKFIGKYLSPSSYKVDVALHDVNELPAVADSYDLIVLDRDCTLQRYHGEAREPEFEEVLSALGHKAEILSNSSYREFRKIGDMYSDILPVSKLVHLRDETRPRLLRVDKGVLRAHIYTGGYVQPCEHPLDFTGIVVRDNDLAVPIVHDYKKPDPVTLRAVIEENLYNGRIFHDPRILMTGDRYLTDIVCGNLAGVETALVLPYRPFTDPRDLIATRYLLDQPVGTMMRLANDIRAGIRAITSPSNLG